MLLTVIGRAVWFVAVENLEGFDASRKFIDASESER